MEVASDTRISLGGSYNNEDFVAFPQTKCDNDMNEPKQKQSFSQPLL